MVGWEVFRMIFSDEDRKLIEWLVKNGHSRTFAEYIVLAYDKQFKIYVT